MRTDFNLAATSELELSLQIVASRQLFQPLQPEQHEEPICSPILHFCPCPGLAADREQVSPDELTEDRAARLATQPIDLVGGDWLVVADDRQHIDRRLREAGLPDSAQKRLLKG